MKRLIILFLAVAFFILVPKANAQIFTTEKLITIDTNNQRLYAWENGQIQREMVVSTGMYHTPTIKGSFNIQWKVPVQDMQGSFPPYEPYYLEDVPNVMYFYGAYAIHGTYWHNDFGTKASHGCVNLTLADAEWLYNWADVGTRVEVF